MTLNLSKKEKGGGGGGGGGVQWRGGGLLRHAPKVKTIKKHASTHVSFPSNDELALLLNQRARDALEDIKQIARADNALIFGIAYQQQLTNGPSRILSLQVTLALARTACQWQVYLHTKID